MKTVCLTTNTPGFHNDLADVVRLMLGACEVREDAGEIKISHMHEEIDGILHEKCIWYNAPETEGVLCALSHREDGALVHELSAPKGEGGPLAEKRAIKRAAKTCLFELIGAVSPELPPWGSLTGIRPTRLFYEAMEEGCSREEAKSSISEKFYVSESRAELLAEIIDMQKGLIGREDGEFDLYAGIPFCTTRCSYCSFAAGELGNGKRVEPYVQALIREMELCAPLLEKHNLKLRAGYIGGGTPTAISAEQLRRILQAAKRLYPGAREWTVEAGRPDTIDREKLQMLREEGVERICVNPQTFHDETLARIGRAHTSQQTIEAFALAREMGFHHINMDFIAALPGETHADFVESIRQAIALAPESITVHALALKHSSKLNEQKYVQTSAEEAQKMVEEARSLLESAGYRPYYLYRQKYMAGNLENVGYAKPGCACLYNIDNMEETAPVLAFGAGAISKWLFPGRDDGGRDERIERAPNVRNIDAYVERVDEMAQRKIDLINQ